MRKQTTWILVADGAGGRFFKLSDERALIPAYTHELIGGMMSSRDVAGDRPGRTFDSGGDGRHAKEPHTDPKRHAKAELAHQIGQILEGERKKRSFDRLILVAPPQFLGDLRASMSKPLQGLVAAEVNKDLSKLSPHQLGTQLDDVLATGPRL
jgi:protein required for attachment to host cells